MLLSQQRGQRKIAVGCPGYVRTYVRTYGSNVAATTLYIVSLQSGARGLIESFSWKQSLPRGIIYIISNNDDRI